MCYRILHHDRSLTFSFAFCKRVSLSALLLFGIHTLVGCNDSVTSKTDFGSIERSLSQSLESQRICFQIAKQFPVTEFAAARWNRFDPLVSLGFMQESWGIENSRSYAPRPTKVKKFALTDAAKPFVEVSTHLSDSANKFCFAHRVLTKLISTAEATHASNGTTWMKVEYSSRVKPLEWFAKNQSSFIEYFPEIETLLRGLDKEEVKSSDFILTSSGFKDPDRVNVEEVVLGLPAVAKVRPSANTNGSGIGAQLQKLFLGF